MVQIEVIRGHWSEDQNGMAIWLGQDKAAYLQWMTGDPDTPMDKPKPTLIIPSDDVDRIVVNWLRGPVGPQGPQGMMGMKGDPG